MCKKTSNLDFTIKPSFTRNRPHHFWIANNDSTSLIRSQIGLRYFEHARTIAGMTKSFQMPSRSAQEYPLSMANGQVLRGMAKISCQSPTYNRYFSSSPLKLSDHCPSTTKSSQQFLTTILPKFGF